VFIPESEIITESFQTGKKAFVLKFLSIFS